ncbi:MAG: proprotein convertase P-domain-containing protein [Bradymonadia bacterium]
MTLERLNCFALLSLLALPMMGCGESETADPEPEAVAAGPNPFLAAQTAGGKEDTAYTNPDGIEVEVDLEADIDAPAYNIARAPAELGQFAVTYLRKRGEFYLESLAEHVESRGRVEWRVDGAWITAEAARNVEPAKLTHFRIRGVNAVLLHSAGRGAEVGKVFEAEVPVKPYALMADAGATCAEPDDHISLSQSVYWYQWDPDQPNCEVPTQKMTITVSRTFPKADVTYPEYDRLAADGKVTAVVLFGQIGDGAITDRDPGMQAFKRMGTWLKDAGFKEVKPAPVGKRYAKTAAGVQFEVDIYSPNDFSGLGDNRNFGNFQRALSEHEIVVYDGHSMLGASDFWARPTYPDSYQIYLYGGCLGYEYYVKPILDGKKGWANLDMMSSVIEVTANALDFAGPAIAKIFTSIESRKYASWKDILVSVRRAVGDSTFGASGVRDNCFTPTGNRCDAVEPTDGEAVSTFTSEAAVAIPDNSARGAKSVLTVPESFPVKGVSIELNVEHSYVGDLKIELSHGSKSAVVWANEGESQQNIEASFDLGGFDGVDASGAWTLKLVDNAAQDAGRLVRWSLTLAR